MNRLVFLVLLIFYFNKGNSFYEDLNDSVGEYEICCTDEKCKDYEIHDIYKNFGKTLFKIWWTADILMSLQIAVPEEELIHYHMLTDIIVQCKNLLKLTNKQKMNHKIDTERLINICFNLLNHQVINFYENLISSIQLCLNFLNN